MRVRPVQIRMDGAKPDGLKFRAPESAVSRWDRTIRAAAAPKPEEVEIEVLGEIGESFWSDSFTTAKMVKDKLKAAGKSPVLVTINSPGGDAFEGVAIYNLLVAHPAPVNVNVIGIAASAASIIAMAGSTIRMAQATTMMIHSASGIVLGNQGDMREFADILEMIDKSCAELYASRTGLTVSDVLAMMKKETWMSAAEAVENGFADVAVTDGKKKAKSETTDSIRASVPTVLLAALGDRQRPVVRLSAATQPGASGTSNATIPKGPQMTLAEQIASYEAKRAANDGRMAELMDKSSAEGRTLEAAEEQEYDGLAAQVQTIDNHLTRLRARETQLVARGTPINALQVNEPAAGAAARTNSGVLFAAPQIQPGIRFARMALALARTHGNRQEAGRQVQANRRWMDQTPEIARVLMAAVPAADTTTTGWASELVYAQNIANDFIEFSRPLTVLGRLDQVRKVPFNVRIGSLTGGTTGYWVGQGKAIPMSKGTTGSSSLGITKAAGLAAYDDEILKSSSPNIETMLRDDLAKAVAQVVDIAFLDPNNGGVANEKPASILYNITPTSASGTNSAAIATDVAAVFAAAIAANLDPMTGVWVMTPTTALKLSLMKTSLGQKENEDITIKGGMWQGLPVIVTPNAYIAGSPQFGNMIVLIIQNEILLADDGDADIQISNEASIEMLDNPTNLSTGATAPTTVVSMFQTQSWAIKAVRYVNWTKRKAAGAAYIQAAAYA